MMRQLLRWRVELFRLRRAEHRAYRVWHRTRCAYAAWLFANDTVPYDSKSATVEQAYAAYRQACDVRRKHEGL